MIPQLAVAVCCQRAKCIAPQGDVSTTAQVFFSSADRRTKNWLRMRFPLGSSSPRENVMRCSFPVRLHLWRCLPLLLTLLILGGCGFFGHKTADTSPTSAKAHKVVKTAYSQMGKQYRLGGSSPQKGFDCSGLIWWAYRQHGVKVPRITTDQAKTGQAVPTTNPRPGDIVVFRTGDSPRGLHTGIYAGDGSFIHSPRKGERVRMESLNIPYWKSKLIAVRRVVR